LASEALKLMPLRVDAKTLLNSSVAADGQIESYQFDAETALVTSAIETTNVQKALDDMLRIVDAREPLLLIGPVGCGKQMLLQALFQRCRNVSVAVVHCNAQTTPATVMHRLAQSCVSVSTNTGRVYRPKEGDRLMLYFKDVHLPKADKYETVQLLAFLLHMIHYNGFFDSDLNWIGLENVQLVLSSRDSFDGGKLHPRFAQLVRPYFVPTPEPDQLVIICQSMLERCLLDPMSRVISRKVTTQLARTLIDIFEACRKRFTPADRQHYQFSPRDLTRVIEGMERHKVDAVKDISEVVEMFAFEIYRVFADRLVDHTSKQTFKTIASQILRSQWSFEDDNVNCGFTPARLVPELGDNSDSLVKMTVDKMTDLTAKAIQVYSRDHHPMLVDLFPEMVCLISSTIRILSKPGGSALMIGRAGTGRRSAALISAAMLHLPVVQLGAGRGYSTKAFYGDLKPILQRTGILGESVVLLIEDYHVADTNFMETINSLLSSGEAPGVYNRDEIDAMLGQLKETHSEQGAAGNLYDFFLNRVRQNCHVVLVMDSQHAQFESTCRSNPALFSQCQMIWIDRWASESYLFMAKSALSRNDTLSHSYDEAAMERLAKQCLSIFDQGAPRLSLSPQLFVVFVSNVARVLSEKLNHLHQRRSYFQGGLTKMNEAAMHVDKLKANAAIQSRQLAEKQKLADQALKNITDSMVQASEQKRELETLTKSLQQEETEIQARKVAVERELTDVEPILTAAKESVGQIRSENLSEIRSLRAPPPVIRDVLEGVLRLMGIFDTSWSSMKSFFFIFSVKEEIVNFNARNITPEIRASVQELLSQKPDSFEEATVKRSSVAAAPLAIWIKANIQYSMVIDKIQPLEQDLANLTRSLNASRKKVTQLEDDLSKVDAKVAALKDEFSVQTRDAEVLKANLEHATSTILSAEGLIGKLDGERSRWQTQVEDISTALARLREETVLAAAFMSFLVHSTEVKREAYIQEWRSVLNIDEFDFVKFMASESDVLAWKSFGLSGDQLSIENAIAVMRSTQTPLLIDPSDTLADWIVKAFADAKPEVIHAQDVNFPRALELAVRFGKTLVVKDVDKIEAFWVPLLRRDFLQQGLRLSVQIGDKVVDYDANFRIFLLTRNANFTTTSDLDPWIAKINFSLSFAGLTSQFLALTIQHENPQLETEKMRISKEEEAMTMQLIKLEESLLNELAASQGDILQNKALIQSLNETKVKSTAIATALKNSKALQATLDQERGRYVEFARAASVLYFALNDLVKLNPMYQFNLTALKRLFHRTLTGETAGESISDRAKTLTTRFERLVLLMVSRAVFKADRLVFALHLCHAIRPKLFEDREWEIFQGSVGQSISDGKSLAPTWVPRERLAAFGNLIVS
jgi:dynein heavy chain 2